MDAFSLNQGYGANISSSLRVLTYLVLFLTHTVHALEPIPLYDAHSITYGRELDDKQEIAEFVEVEFLFSSDLKKSCNNDGDCKSILWPSNNTFSTARDDYIYHPYFICSPPYMDPVDYFTQSLKEFMDPIPQGQKATKISFEMEGHYVCRGNYTSMSIILQDDTLTWNPIEFISQENQDRCCEVCTERSFYTTRVDYGLDSYLYGQKNVISFLPNQGTFCLSHVIMRIYYKRYLPDVTNIIPRGGPNMGGTTIVVYGIDTNKGFNHSCTINSIDIPAGVNDKNELICKIPHFPIGKTGSATLVVSATIDNEILDSPPIPFYFFEELEIHNISYTSTQPGDLITIYGKNFMQNDEFELIPQCKVGDILSPQTTYSTPSMILCTIPNTVSGPYRNLPIFLSLNKQQWTQSPDDVVFNYRDESPTTTILWIFASCTCFLIITVLIIYKIVSSAKKRRSQALGSDHGVSQPLTHSYLFEGKIEGQMSLAEIKVGARIGKGSYGEVYLGTWQGTTVALKKLPAHKINEEFLREFTREANLMKTLRHPNVLQFLGASLNPPDICIVTEYMPRGSLNKIIHDKSIDLTWEMKRKIALDAAKGMAYLHYRTPSIIHRDLKSHNLLVDDVWKVKVCDFGLSRIITEGQNNEMTACGTPSWTAPEVLNNLGYTTKADVYSFGIVLWEMASRAEPFAGMPSFQVLFAIANKGVRPVIPDDCPNEFKQLIIRCWDQDPNNRPDFKEIIEYLESCKFSN